MRLLTSLCFGLCFVFMALSVQVPTANAANPIVIMRTTMGDITIELNPKAAPQTVANFEAYVKEGFFNGLIFHRVIDNFMIQGGGFDRNMNQKRTKAPIQNEADNGLKNDKYTIAMARTNDPHSATAQFFINTKKNDFLNFKSKTTQGWGYTVFGKVIDGFKVVDAIGKVKTGFAGPMQDVPVEQVIIKEMTMGKR